jgi:hypothetical protein
MAKLGYRHTETGVTLYVILTDANDSHMKSSDSTFVSYVAANWGDYDLPMSESDSYLYEYTMPSISDGEYTAEIFLQDGASPSLTDTKVGEQSFSWKDNDFFNLTDVSGGTGDTSNIGSW